MSDIVLIVAAHCDDEVLGCGGTIARHVYEGDVVYTVFMTDGESSRPNADQNSLVIRYSAAEQARKILGIKENFFLNFPDNRLDSFPLIEVIKRLQLIIDQLRPNIIYTHHHGDLNIDHTITHRAVMTACRPLPGHSVREIYAFEVVSSTDWAAPFADPFIPNYYVDISSHLSKKLDALKAYEIEMREAPHSRNLEHLTQLAHHRGHTVGVIASEAFSMIRCLI
jgi:LmbE family N-acetylglucosaminyl deacetylase